jgi:hypothetical protein
MRASACSIGLPFAVARSNREIASLDRTKSCHAVFMPLSPIEAPWIGWTLGLPKPHARAAAVLVNKDDASGFEGSADLFNRHGLKRLTRFKARDCVVRNAGQERRLLHAKAEGDPCHLKLKRVHYRDYIQFMVDIQN